MEILAQKFPVTYKTVLEADKKFTSNCIADMTQKVGGDENLLKLSLEKFKKSVAVYEKTKNGKKVVGGLLLKYIIDNNNKSAQFCKKIFSDGYAPIENSINTKEDYTFDQLTADVEKLVKDYNKKTSGYPGAAEALAEFYNTFEKNKQTLRHLQGYKKQVVEAMLQTQKLQAENNKVAEDLANVKEQHKLQLEKQRDEMAQTKQFHEQAVQKLKEEMEAKILEEKRRSEDYQKTFFAEQAKQSAEMIKQIQSQSNEMMQQLQRQNEGHSQQMAQIAQAIANIPPPPQPDCSCILF